jgi:hypothetical protein
MRAALKAISGVVLTAALVSPAGAAAPQCPPKLLIFQRAMDPPAGTRVFDRAPQHPWANVEFSEGPPEEGGWLAPDSTRHAGKEFVNHWKFSKSGGIWLSCDYQGTSMSVVVPLAKTVTACDVTYDSDVAPPQATGFKCQ